MVTEPEKPKRTESYDFKLFFGFHGGMMVLMLLRFAARVGIAFEIVVVGGLLTTGVVLALRHRRKNQWHWPGTDWKGILGALVASALVAYFLGAALPGTTILNPNLFPWMSAGGGILLYAVLSSLNFCHPTEQEFLKHCGANRPIEPQAPPIPAKAPVPKWKGTVMNVFGAYFLAVWIAAVGFFWKFNAAYASGSKEPTATQTEKLTNHGHVVYITPKQKRFVKLLERSMMFGIPSVFVIAALLHFTGVQRFTHTKDQN